MRSAGVELSVSNDQARGAAARSGIYAMMARAMAVPDEQLHEFFVSGDLGSALAAMGAEVPYQPPVADFEASDLAPPVEFQAEFIAFFEIGEKSPPCPLYEGAIRHERGRKALMEDLLRFYHHFDVKMSESVRELPDHLLAELEFMHYLCFLEARLIETGGDDADGRSDLLRAQRDFLTRHLAVWVPELARKTAEREGPKFYRGLLGFLDGFIKIDLEYLEKNAETAA